MLFTIIEFRAVHKVYKWFFGDAPRFKYCATAVVSHIAT